MRPAARLPANLKLREIRKDRLNAVATASGGLFCDTKEQKKEALLSEKGFLMRYTDRGENGGGMSAVRDNKEINDTCERAIAAIAQGDKQALGVLYDQMARAVFSVAYGITGVYQDAEDVLQNTMIGIAAHACTYRQGGSPKAWILTIARNCAVDLVRRRQRESAVQEPLPQERLFDQSYLPRWEVIDMLRLLEPEERQIVVFHLYAGLRHREIAGMLQLSHANVQKKYQRALKKLRVYMKETGGGRS